MSMARMQDFRFWARLAANPWVVIASIAAGLAVGQKAPILAGHMAVIGDIYVTLLKMVVLPFLVAAVIFSLRKLFADPNSAAILPRILKTFFAIFLAAVLTGLLIALLGAPGSHLSEDTLLAMGKLAGPAGIGGSHDSLALFARHSASHAQSLSDTLLTLIPSNIFAALTQGETLKVLVFSLLFGLAVGKAPDRVAEALTDALETVYQACLVLTDWFNLALPLALFAILASQTAKLGLEPIRAMLNFILAYLLGAVVLVLLSWAALRAVSRRAWAEVLRSQRQPLLLALATRSSPACMPTMIESLVDTLGFARSRVELLVPLGVSLLRIGPGLYYVLASLFVAQLYGVHPSPAQLAVVVVGSILAGIASAGMNGLMAMTLTGLLCNYLGLPFEAALALFIAADPVCDPLQTLVAVAGNAAFAAIGAGHPATGGSPAGEEDGERPGPVAGLENGLP
jgi:Na+/H+-dicarboxylate symporter